MTTPPEVRRSIYRNVFQGAEIRLDVKRYDEKGHQLENIKIELESADLHHAITETCRLFRQESLETSLQTILLKASFRGSPNPLGVIKELLISPLYMRCISSLYLEARSTAFLWPFDAFPALETLTLTFETCVEQTVLVASSKEMKQWLESSDLRDMARHLRSNPKHLLYACPVERVREDKARGFRIIWKDRVLPVLGQMISKDYMTELVSMASR